MDIYLSHSSTILADVKEIIIDFFNVSEIMSSDIVENKVRNHFDRLKPNLYFLIETNYIDKIYRDSYYNYFSTKLKAFNRNSIKISIFNCPLSIESFRDEDSKAKLKENYFGFFILRPTPPNVIGRSVINPNALNNNNFTTCLAYIPSTVNSIKFDSVGFPHSSQDSETMTCAETTLWSVMEYFGNKYPEYKPILPSQIIELLRNSTNERQLPSTGLNINQMSYVLKEFGFAPKIYSKSEYGSETFFKLISCYIESGIPLIISLDNLNYLRSPGAIHDYIGHAVLCTGHEDVADIMIDSLVPIDISRFSSQNIKIFDFDNTKKRFVFIDDNHPIYQKAVLNNPTEHYNNQSWNTCEISHFIAPLYRKVYLEAYEAKQLAINFLTNSVFCLNNESEVLMRSFLTSSRSYKQYVALNSTIDNYLKDEILELEMPKFIWIFELSNKDIFKKGMIDGLLIFDATEPKSKNYESLIVAIHSNSIVKYSKNVKSLEKISLHLQPFLKFNSNLKK